MSRASNAALTIALLAMSACQRTISTSVATPISAEHFMNPIVRQRADPMVFRDADGTYYLAATVPEYDRIELRAARTIQALGAATPVVIWRKHDVGEMGAHIWAPEIHHIDGKWYVYFAAGRADSVWNIRIYALESSAADPLRGPWTEKGQIHTGMETFSLDATTFQHRGSRYLVWAQKDPTIRGNTNLYIAAMSNPWTITGEPAMLSRPEYAWETIGYLVNEGPAVLIRHGRVFLTYSASATDANYCMGMLTASDTANLLDPRSWTKSREPVFRTNEATGQYGPGHNSFTVDANGADVLVYHARNYRDIVGDPLHDPNRHMRAQYIEWNADGTPHFGVPVADGPAPATDSAPLAAPQRPR
jgi:GH43 family beta-xylosidase